MLEMNKLAMTHHVQRVAHRGGAALAPENTLAAFRNAFNFPIDAIELDVHMSRDGHAIVFHDNTVDKLTNGTGNILELDFAYLRSLNAAAHFPGGWPQPQQWKELEPDRPAEEAGVALAPHAGLSAVAVVGHEPNLSELASHLLTGEADAVGIRLKKGGVICIDVGGHLEPGSVTLLWMATPRILRSLG